MRQRLGIAQALLGNPDILILDEPANGLDPAGIREIRQLVRHLASERGIAVFVSSHLLSEVEQTCDRVAIIHRGRTLASGPVRELVDRVASDRLRLTARPARRAVEVLEPFGAAEIAGEGAGVEDEGTIDARIPKAKVPDALRALTAAGRGRLRRRAVARLARRGVPRGHGRRDGMRFPGLVENEILKFARQRRFRVVVLILVGLIGLIASRSRGAAIASSPARTGTSRRRSGWRGSRTGCATAACRRRCSGGRVSSSTACSTTSSAT